MDRIIRLGRSRVFRHLLLVTGLVATAGDGLAEPVSPQPAELAAVFESLAADIPGHFYDVDALAEALNYEVDAAAAYVAEHIAYDPYAGVMRGPSGTLSARAGSVWDQAVLSAALIHAMGGEALLVRGTLPTPDMARLFERAFEPADPGEPAITVERISEALTGLAPADDLDDLARVFAVDGEAELEVATLEETVSEGLKEALAGVDVATRSDVLVSFRQQVIDNYVWVRYRDTPRDPWIDSHPAFGGEVAPVTKPEEFLDDTVPEDRLHRIEITLEIERTAGGGPETLAIMTPYRRPAANLAAVHVPVSISPSEYEPDGSLPSFWVPGINGRVPTGAKAFTAQGLVVDAADAMSGPGVFGELSRTLSGGIGGLDERAAPRLTGILLKVTHIAPGDVRRTRIRRLVDLRGGEELTAASHVTFEGTMVVVTGPENMARRYRALFSNLAGLLRTAPALRSAMEKALRGEDPFDDLPPAEFSPFWAQMLTQAPLITAQGDESLVWLRQSPLVLMRRISRDLNERTLPRQTVDIVFQDHVALQRDDDAVRVDPEHSLRLGVRRSVLETLWTGGEQNREALTDDELIMLKSRADFASTLPAALFSMADREAMTADLEEGGLLLASSRHPVWWHTDPATGVTLIRSANGGSSPTTEELILQTGLTLYSVGALTYGVVDCGMTYGGGKGKPAKPNMLACCAQANVLLFTGGAIIGNALGAAMGILGELSNEAINATAGLFDPAGSLCSAVIE